MRREKMVLELSEIKKDLLNIGPRAGRATEDTDQKQLPGLYEESDSICK